jgi:hypothetical protein
LIAHLLAGANARLGTLPALHYAVIANHPEVCHVLLAHDPSLVRDGLPAEAPAPIRSTSSTRPATPHRETEAGDRPTLRALSGATNGADGEQEMLQMALARGHAAIARLLSSFKHATALALPTNPVFSGPWGE